MVAPDGPSTLQILGVVGAVLLGFLTAIAALVGAVRFLVQPVVALAVQPLHSTIAALDKAVGELKSGTESNSRRAGDHAQWQQRHEEHDNARFEKTIERMDHGFKELADKLAAVPPPRPRR